MRVLIRASRSVSTDAGCSLQIATKIPLVALNRRNALLIGPAILIATAPLQSKAIDQGVVIRKDLTPDPLSYDKNDPKLRAGAALLQKALNAQTVEEEERLWTQLIQEYENTDAPWTKDLVGRAYGNRGNARSRQGKLDQALIDYTTAINLCPWSVDPVLNRGVAYENMGRFEESVQDYRSVLAVQPDDPSAWNNLGNVSGWGLGRWKEAAGYFEKAIKLAPQFSFAAANRALALYEAGEVGTAVREMQKLLRRYPGFDDMRAALAAAYWQAGKTGEAEMEWTRVDDTRYKDQKWLETERHWPPTLRAALGALIEIR
jgi:tetratricopeptide (TPR) repeat protein